MTEPKEEQPKDPKKSILFKLEGTGITKDAAESDLEKKAKKLTEQYTAAREIRREYDLQFSTDTTGGSCEKPYHARDTSYEVALQIGERESNGKPINVVGVTILANYSVPILAVTTSPAGGPSLSDKEESRTHLV